MNATITELFADVAHALTDAHLVAWDGCHKIYLAMDETQAAWFRAEYPHTVEGDAGDMLFAVNGWWDESCGLRFVSAVATNHANPNAGFTDLIPQFADEDEDYDDDDEDDDEDDECVCDIPFTGHCDACR